MNGILLVDKERDWTSNDVCQKLKGMLHTRRVGHSGTLDPMATGLLTVFVGRATRAVEFAEAQDKRYVASLRLGISTDTQDTTGNILRRCAQDIGENELRAAIAKFTGEIEQIPPMYSAIKINGQKLYDIARRGGSVERKPRRVTISSIELLGRDKEDWVLDICCSKGTYIRTLCNDIGDTLGCGGCMSALRRTRAGAFSVENAHTIAQLQSYMDSGEIEKLLLPVDTLFSQYPIITVGGKAEKRLRCGGTARSDLGDGTYRVYSESGEFLLLGEIRQGELETIKSFFEV